MSYRSLWLTIGLAIAHTVYGQTFGEITGHVADASGASVAAAAISTTNTNTNAARKTLASASGDYAFPSLPPVSPYPKLPHNIERFKVFFRILCNKSARTLTSSLESKKYLCFLPRTLKRHVHVSEGYGSV